MQKIRRLVAVASVTALAGAFATGPASAATAEVYLGSAAGRALNLKIANPVTSETLQATLGAATAKATSEVSAEATGVGQALPVLDSTSVKASATQAAPGPDNQDANCAAALPANDIVSLGLACGSASASAVGGLPVAVGEGSVASLTLDTENALKELDAVTTTIGDTLSGALDSVCETLEAACPATTTVDDLVTSVLKTQTLDASIGKSTASVTTTASTVTSEATAHGAIVKILPLPQVNGLPSTQPVATIEVGAASAKAVYDRAAGKTLTPEADPALVRVRLNTVLTDALAAANLPVPTQEFEVAPNQTTSIPGLDGTPLQSHIYVAAGRVVTNPDGTQGAIADGVKLTLLEGIGESAPGAFDGGITLELAHAEAGVAGSPAVIDNTPAPQIQPPDIARELPRTGGNPFLPIAGVAALSVAVLVRRASARSAARASDS